MILSGDLMSRMYVVLYVKMAIKWKLGYILLGEYYWNMYSVFEQIST
jgi:hypothetical protein